MLKVRDLACASTYGHLAVPILERSCQGADRRSKSEEGPDAAKIHEIRNPIEIEIVTEIDMAA